MAQPVERDELVAQLRGYYGDEYDQIEHEIENHLDEPTGDPDEQAVIAFVVHNDRYDRGLEPSSERVSSLRSEAARSITQHRASQHGDDGLEHE